MVGRASGAMVGRAAGAMVSCASGTNGRFGHARDGCNDVGGTTLVHAT